MPSGERPFPVPPLADVTRRLAAVASGAERPQLIIRRARVLSAYSERILEDREIWIEQGRIAAVHPCGTLPPGDAAREYDARGGLLAPGLVDAHLHIESSMVTACAYAEAALRNGTTTIFCDSHEIANVLGARGVEMMLEDARQAPLSIFLTVPSTVPATHPGLETAGGSLDASRIGKLFDRWPEAVALGEKMDFVSVARGEEGSHAILREALRRGRPVSGHVFGHEFVAAYAASGVTDTHEAVDPAIAEALLEAGLWIFLRSGPPGSPWNNLPDVIRAVTQGGLSPKRFCLCTDDRDAADLLQFGMDWAVRQAAQAGLKPAAAWSLGSLHAATRFGMDGEIGALGHGRRADMVLLNDSLEVENTWYGGRLVVEGKRITPLLDEALSERRRYRYPARAYRTLRLKKKLPPLVPELPPAVTKARVIRLLPGQIVTEEAVLPLESRPLKEFCAAHRLVHLAVLERHGQGGHAAHGLLQGFGFSVPEAAVASSVGHDAHNVVVAGTDAFEMRAALQALRKTHGGVCVVQAGKVLAHLPLPVAGLLSDQRVGEVAAQVATLREAWEAVGCRMPYMGFNLLPLSVIPALRLTDKGLVRVATMELAPLFE
ncbi:MAG: adenine deaminase C-terminal domain-containing protein [Verrucomicrobium sp.]|nr:adenine deaminase C-terminal domain-containing protein [Verrucomicrobium sp.]